MSGQPLYLLDSNCFIQAHRQTYPLDVATSFWNKVKQLSDNGKIISIDKVKSELYKGDTLHDWCKDNLHTEFFVASNNVMAHYAQVVQAAKSRTPAYKQSALATFFNAEEADAWLIAHALQKKMAIVTHEVSAPLGTGNVKIPDICTLLNVRSVTLIDMFRELGENF